MRIGVRPAVAAPGLLVLSCSRIEGAKQPLARLVECARAASLSLRAARRIGRWKRLSPDGGADLRYNPDFMDAGRSDA